MKVFDSNNKYFFIHAINMIELKLKNPYDSFTTMKIDIPWIEITDEGIETFSFFQVIEEYPLSIIFYLEHQEMIQYLLSLDIPDFLFAKGKIPSAICRCIERGYSLSLESVCKYAVKNNIKPEPLYLLGKYYPINNELYQIASKYGYRDLTYEKVSPSEDLNLSKYIGYRICYHVFYHCSNLNHINQMLEYWFNMDYRNCTVDAIQDLFLPNYKRPLKRINSVEEIYIDTDEEHIRLIKMATLLLNKLKGIHPVSNLSPQAFIDTYWTSERLFTSEFSE